MMKKVISILICILVFYSFSLAQSTNRICPEITVIALDEDLGETVIFTAEVKNLPSTDNIKYSWTLEGGKIISGHFEKTLKAARQSKGSELTATVEIFGIPRECIKTATTSATFIDEEPVYAEKFNQYGKVSKTEEERYLKEFAVRLQSKESFNGIIHLRNEPNLIDRLNWIKVQLTDKNINENRLIFAISDNLNKETELWITPQSVSTDCENCLIIKAQEFERLQKLFQKKPTSKNQ